MKKAKSYIAMLLACTLVCMNPIISLAGSKKGGPKSSESNKSKTENVIKRSKNIKLESNKIDKNDKTEKKQNLDTKQVKNESIKQEQDNNERIKPIKEDKKIKKEVKKSIKDLKERAKKAYSQEELTKLQEAVNEMKLSYPGIKTIPVENIISKRMNIKFDTPPVIKEGRTLIPVRALTQAFGAQVNWNSEDKIVTIVKDDMEMKVQIGSNVAYINGEEVQLDVSAETMNGRTVVPLRFIVEKMGLKVNWDEENQTIEINEEETKNEDELINEEDVQIIKEADQQEKQTNEEDSDNVIVEETDNKIEDNISNEI
ncbi:copper amine oxidase N-terminal domain-containing protein [Anaerophilus nitritogenes]|uniref:copper amine oxidase N-terminal domain-containing protein n=1 Tax=Anaerophilus nitritogenes TaxID=2498136 RepID=UPI00101B7975|nr:copper amine oxidase N-terminal domain-containing protein [Anaerophilus nitritogenes]